MAKPRRIVPMTLNYDLIFERRFDELRLRTVLLHEQSGETSDAAKAAFHRLHGAIAEWKFAADELTRDAWDQLPADELAELRAKIIAEFEAVLLPEGETTLPVVEGRCSKPLRPPALGEKLVYFLAPRSELDGVLGDLAELFERLACRHGNTTARWWYWWQVVQLAWAGALRAAKGVATLSRSSQ